MKNKGWIGVDLDGTLAHYDGWKGPEHIGEPVPLMLERVKRWMKEGKEVRIFTARVSSNNPDKVKSFNAILQWCIDNIGTVIPITSEKDFGMVELWDDRCVQVILNTGQPIQMLK